MGKEGDRAYLQRSFFPKLHNGNGLLVSGLGEGVFQRRAAVADPLPAHVLRTVEMAQGHIVKGGEDGGVHVVRASHADLLRLAPRRPRDELVGDQHIAPGRVQGHMPDGAGHGVRKALHPLLREEAADMGGLQEWQQPEVHRAAVILQGHRRHLAVIDRSDVDPPALHEAVGKGEAFRRVVVAADQQHRQGPVRQLD